MLVKEVKIYQRCWRYWWYFFEIRKHYMASRTHFLVYYKNYGGFIRMGRTKEIFPKLNGGLSVLVLSVWINVTVSPTQSQGCGDHYWQ